MPFQESQTNGNLRLRGGFSMKEYWKAKLLKDLIKINRETSKDTTITEDYICHLKTKLKLVQQAYRAGFKDAKDAKEVKDDIN